MKRFKWNWLSIVCGTIAMLAFLMLVSPVVRADGIDGITLTPVGPSTTFTMVGTYTSTTPVTGFSAPNEAYAVTFALPTTPNPAGFAFLDTIDGVFGIDTTVMVNGVSFANSQIIFFGDALGGGFDLCLGTDCAMAMPPSPDSWIILGETLFSGDVSNPKFVSGPITFLPFAEGEGDNSTYTITATPEPASLVLLGSGLLGLGIFGRRARHSR